MSIKLITILKEALNVSWNPYAEPKYKFKVGEEVMSEEDYNYRASNNWKSNSWSDGYSGDIAKITVREPDVDSAISNHKDFYKDCMYDTDWIADEGTEQPWYLLEYPREESFEDVTMRWVPEEDLRNLDNVL